MKHPVSLVFALSILIATTTSCAKESAAAGRATARFTLTGPVDQQLAQGATQKFTVTVDRTGFAEAVQVRFTGLPTGVKVEGDVIPAGLAKQEFQLIAAPTAAVGDKQIVTITATAVGVTAVQTFALTVKPKA